MPSARLAADPKEILVKVRTAKRQAEFSVSDTGSGLPVDAGSISLDPGRGVVSVGGT